MGIFCLSFGSDRATEFHSSKASLSPSTIQSQLLQRAREEVGGGGRRMQTLNEIICLPRRRQTQAQDGGP